MLQVTVRNTANSPSLPEDFTLLYGPDTAGTAGRQWVYYKISDGTETGTITVSIDGTSTVVKMARIYAFRNAAMSNFVEDGGFSSSGSGSSVSAPPVTTSGEGELVVSFVFVCDDNAVGSFTGETGGDWQEAVPEYTTTSGEDGCIQLQTAVMISAGTISGGTYTMSASDPWGVRAFAIKPAV